MTRKVILTIVIVLVAIGALAGVGFAAFRAGTAYGISQSDAVAAAIRENPDAGSVMPFGGGPRGFGFMAPQGYGMWGWRGGFGHGGFGFGFLQCLIPLFGFFLLFALFRLIFRPWGWRRGWHGNGPWGSEGVPPHFAEWHQRAHGQAPPPPPPPADNPPSSNA
jgi:ABC-type multidrug transport system permease subunit